MARTTRPVALARRGMVATPHYLASGVGLRILQDGGSAVDAAVAVNATLGVVYPHMTGVGGDAFWLVYEAATGQVHALNGSGRAAGEASAEYFLSRGHRAIPTRGPLAAVTVPGAVDSWCAAHERFGSLPLTKVLEPAIGYARDGYPMCAGQAECLRAVADVLAEHAPGWEVLDGAEPTVGRPVLLPRLAATLHEIAVSGRNGFYTGAVAEEITGTLRRAGGLLTMADFAAHRSEWTEPLSTGYRGFDCYQHPPNSQGFAHLMLLNVLEGLDVAAMGDAEYVHTVTEATKLVFADRDRYLTDPGFGPAPLHHLLSKDYAAELRAQIAAGPVPAAPPAAAAGGDTTCSVVVDGAGNAAAVIQSLYHECGSAFVGGDTGVVLQNRGSFFSLDPGDVNRLEPGKRTAHTLMPGMMLRDGELRMVYGTMGGEGQPQTSTAVVTRVVDFGHDVQRAIDAPRWLYGRTWGEQTRELRIEDRFGPEVATGLRRRGHTVRVVADFDEVMGHAQAIQVDPERGLLMGGADPRGEGSALGW
ncbi:gamma-glutamyltransferase [Pseudonocardia acaciae]|uniref:gamma-glutamyltransferase n=1 Tax=Pseudonocardia acaciae TaxID=551276 RepID=UPI00056C87D1|nr:gamma-glutamyltransferase [Pseudonocardia acaciae]